MRLSEVQKILKATVLIGEAQMDKNITSAGAADLIEDLLSAAILKATVLTGEDQMDKNITSAGAADLIEDLLSAAAKGCALLTGVPSEQVIRTSKVVGVEMVCIVRGKVPPDSFIELARSCDIPVLLSQYSLFIACGRLYMNGIRGLDGSW